MNDGGGNRNDYDDRQNRQKVLVDVGNHVAQEVAEKRDAYSPQKAADNIVCQKSLILHPSDSRDDRRKRAYGRQETGKNNGLFPVLFVEPLGCFEMFGMKEHRFLAVK